MRTLLIANRGEIAVRIARACRERGVRSVAVYSDADADALHVSAADDAVRIGPPPARDSYLLVEALMQAASESGADALHPGYGFLSERAELAQACRDAGVTFVGPPVDAIRLMGSKAEARRLMEQAGVPCVPGQRVPSQDADAFHAAANALRYPVLVKASAGGGGKGMRRVESPAGLDAALDAARREATSAFGDGTLLLERCLDHARHIEVQIAADGHGACIHLGERECSLQRRHQKVLEESPSPVMRDDLRRRMGAAAIAAARAVDYVNVGTVEFLVTRGQDGVWDEFFFLEMNTRLQVEHPVTEAVTGIDLVHLQLDIAEGRPLPWPQDRVSLRGHAIECRIYAEDPAQQFLPQAGRVLVYREPQGPGIRVDSGIREGDDVSPFYDPLLAKLTVHAETRERALARAQAALRQFVVLGLRTNIPYLQRVLTHPDLRSGEVDIHWLERVGTDLRQPPPEWRTEAAHMLASALRRVPARRAEATGAAAAPETDPWVTLGAWRG